MTQSSSSKIEEDAENTSTTKTTTSSESTTGSYISSIETSSRSVTPKEVCHFK